MKKILFAAYSLDVGGIETALINLVKELKDDYKITIVLEKKQGIFINDLPDNVDVIEYSISENKNVFLES